MRGAPRAPSRSSSRPSLSVCGDCPPLAIDQTCTPIRRDTPHVGIVVPTKKPPIRIGQTPTQQHRRDVTFEQRGGAGSPLYVAVFPYHDEQPAGLRPETMRTRNLAPFINDDKQLATSASAL